MSEIKDLIVNDENLIGFFADKPVFEMLNEGLTIKKIWSEISFLNFAKKSERKNEKSLEDNFDHRIVLFEGVLREMVDMVKDCLTGKFFGADEPLKFDESLFKNNKVNLKTK